MAFSVVHSCGLHGIEAFLVRVEVDLAGGQLPSWQMVGLPENAVRESKDRVLTALRNCGFSVPAQKITVNLSPASLRKEGTCFDLPMALGLLACQGHVPVQSLESTIFLGELSLDAQVKGTSGVLSCGLAARRLGIKRLVVAADNVKEAAVIEGLEVYAVSHLSELVSQLRGELAMTACAAETLLPPDYTRSGDFAEIRGQYHAKRALEIAAAGAHNVLLAGPPGSGKSLLCQRLPTILPPLSFDEALETTKIYSRMGLIGAGCGIRLERPFRSPHHSISDAGLMGGGSYPRPGEISLAHHGVLFLDELPEFKRHVLELLRQPLEEGRATITRVHGSVDFPAQFLLAAAMNPCPCGYLGHASRPCVCAPAQAANYRNRLSGPLLDRIDLYIELAALNPEELLSGAHRAESSQSVRERVCKAREIQRQRLASDGIYVNAQMRLPQLERECRLSAEVKQTAFSLLRKDALSARGYHRLLKVARTIADLAGAEHIRSEHVLEAYQYRYKSP